MNPAWSMATRSMRPSARNRRRIRSALADGVLTTALGLLKKFATRNCASWRQLWPEGRRASTSKRYAVLSPAGWDGRRSGRRRGSDEVGGEAGFDQGQQFFAYVVGLFKERIAVDLEDAYADASVLFEQVGNA
jgi:hypothetical protein